MTPLMSAPLVLRGVGRRFGGIHAVSDVSLELGAHSITGLIGPNGAGKTTLFNLIAGSMAPSRGSIRFHGQSLVGRDPGDIARSGLVRSFQSPMLLPALSVRDHLVQAALSKHVGRPFDLWRKGLNRRAEQARIDATHILAFTGLQAYANTPAESLAYGLRKILGVAMAVCAAPRLLLADEPAAGLNATETSSMTALLQAIAREKSIPIVVIEHDMRLVMTLCERIVVLSAGRVIADGTPAQVRNDRAFIDAYLGTEPAR